ncbi:hypothetical protein GXW84_33290 [Rhodococcus sp. IEGM 248]|nr:hypothetical protein [Rhodococcus opacus]NDV09287.1 hypothetical protein [Rhodococcus sp. IEGM 248]
MLIRVQCARQPVERIRTNGVDVGANELFVTEVAMADEIAAAGDLVKGKSATHC